MIGTAAMTKQFLVKCAVNILLIVGMPVFLAPASRAQSMGVNISVSTSPSGMSYSVDGQFYTGPFSAVWPIGSKHVLSVVVLTQDELQNKTRSTFGGWQSGSTTLPGGSTITVTADPAQPSFQAIFGVQYALDIIYFACPDPNNCQSSGTIYVNNSPITSDIEMYMDANSSAVLTAVPNPGYIFTGWTPGAHQTIQGVVDTVSLTEPVIVRPTFQPTRNVNLVTVPAGLKVYADATMVPTPSTIQWGMNTTHSVGAVSPQQATDGTWWAFQSWSDNGAATHSYTVAPLSNPDTLIATYVPVGVTQIISSPFGLPIVIDGRSNWTTYNFPWGVGETHHIAAPLQAIDSQNRVWAFSNWSNGAPAVQDFTVPASAAPGGIRLIATYNPVGHLLINSPLSGVTIQVDDTQCTTPCDLQRPAGSTVHVTAPASVPIATGSRADFTGWSGTGSSSLTWTGTLGSDAVTLNASFRYMNLLTTSSSPANAASITVAPPSPDGYYDSTTSVVVNAAALAGYKFRYWTGDLSSSSVSASLSMNAPRSVQAVMDTTPFISPAGVSNAAGTTPVNSVAPGSVVSVFGASLASATAVGQDSPLVQTLGGVTVQVNSLLLPLFFVSPSQINLQLPTDLPLGAQTLVVSPQGMSSVKASFTVVRNAPGLFSQTSNGIAFAAALHEDGTPVTTAAPALPNELLTVYGTGFGPTSPARPEGFAIPSSPAYNLVDGVTVKIGGYTAVSPAAFAAPGKVGLDVVQFRLGTGAPTATNADLHITINGQDSNTVTLPVQ